MSYESTSAILHPSRHICSRSVSALASHDGSVGTKSPSANGVIKDSRILSFLITVSWPLCLSSLNTRASAANISCSKCSIRVKSRSFCEGTAADERKIVKISDIILMLRDEMEIESGRLIGLSCLSKWQIKFKQILNFIFVLNHSFSNWSCVFDHIF